MTPLRLLSDHLLQSTVCALVIALGTLAFRRDRAAVRHAMWLAASVKFLIPFAALVALGGALGVRTAATAPVRREITLVLNDTRLGLPRAGLGLDDPSLQDASADAMSTTTWAALAIWFAGTLTLATSSIVRWRRVGAIARASAPIDDGPAVAALRAIERADGHTTTIDLRYSDTTIEPGVFGIRRPILILPKSIVDHFADDHIATILAHEVAHVRRRDNLAAAVQMAVEALFWFHPLVWWLGARQIEERERACDEAVLQSGSEPELYAATILKACRIYVESPLACVAGVTGSNLARRIERIMTSRAPRRLSRARKAVLALAAIGAVAAPISLGAITAPVRYVQREDVRTVALRVSRPQLLQVTPQQSGPLPQFEVASIKPNTSGKGPVRIQTSPGGRFTAINVTLKNLVQFAYKLQSFQVSGGPDWITSDRFDIVAKGDESSDVTLMVRALLLERFALGTRSESREQPLYALVLSRPDGRLGTDLHRSTTRCDDAKNCGIRLGLGTMNMASVSIAQLATNLSGLLDRSVIDRTGLDGEFDATLKWTPDQSTPGLALKAGFAPAGAIDPNGPSIFTAVQEQLGLKLDAQKGPVVMLVIDHAEHPANN
ncbi:MAG TPA: M56 family metallopeptidase [Vicinamibacterales bacterium]|nr:M56 family metallopeptidase [Vicinamibacterales bacterium]